MVRPTLPAWLDWIELEGLRVADATVDLRLERSEGGVSVADARVEGELELVVDEAGEAHSAGPASLG